MKIVNAEWEIRNLGVKTIEISIEKNDTLLSEKDLIATIEKHIRQYEASYVVVKSDSRYSAISLYLQRAGFIFMENQIDLRANRTDIADSVEKYRKVCAGAHCRLANEEDIQMIFSEMERGIFDTDRVALDPYFGVKAANRRYLFWIQDELKRGAWATIYTFEDDPIGFSLDKASANGKTIISLLGGLFNQPETRRLGAILRYAGAVGFCNSGFLFLKTAVSSNNLNILQLHLAFGCRITAIKNVLIKHCP